MTAAHARLAIVLAAIAAAAALRLVPHPPNFTPIGAMALFGGATLGRRALSFAAPLGALLLSDLVLGFYPGMASVYASTALAVLVGWTLIGRRSAGGVVLAALASACLFFLVTNFAVWAGSGMYKHDAAGLLACFTAALPFFQNSLAGDLFWSVVLFGGFALAERLVPRLREPLALRA